MGMKKPRAVIFRADYRSWRAHSAALLERMGISAGVMRERDWRQLFIRGKMPEDAAREAEMLYWNQHRPLQRLKRKR
jgi:hypothetical protein